MNREQKIARLQSLLDRVQTRAKEARRKPRVLPQSPPAVSSAVVAVAPADAMGMEPDEVDETRPFARMLTPPTPQVPIQERSDDSSSDVEIEIGSSEFDFDDVGAGGLEIVGEADGGLFDDQGEPSEPSTSPEHAEPTHVATPGPAQGARPKSPGAGTIGIDVDHAASAKGPRRHPSIEMLGQTVDLPEAKTDKEIEVDASPIPTPLKNRPTGEMEAVIPGSMAPGVYPPESAGEEQVFGGTPVTKDWDLPEEFSTPPSKTPGKPSVAEEHVEPQKSPSVQAGAVELDDAFALLEPGGEKQAGAAQVQDEGPAQDPLAADKSGKKPAAPERSEGRAVAEKPGEEPPVAEKPAEDERGADVSEGAGEAESSEPEAITKKPADLDLQQLAVADHEAAKRLEPQAVSPVASTSGQPVVFEIAGKRVSVEMSEQDVAAFMGAVESAAPASFFEVLDASLALGKD